MVAYSGVEGDKVARREERVEGGVPFLDGAKMVVAIRTNNKTVCRRGCRSKVMEIMFA